MTKTGVAYITCNRQQNWRQLAPALDRSMADVLVVVNDGTPYQGSVYPDFLHVIQHDVNRGVGAAKNSALRHLLAAGCDWLFLIEDDIVIRDAACFAQYMRLAEVSRVLHLNFGYHGDLNVDVSRGRMPMPRVTVSYGPMLDMALNRYCVGAFQLFHRSVIERVGFFDEQFVNAKEHAELTWRIIRAGMHPPHKYFADVAESQRFFTEIGTVAQNSVIANDPLWRHNLQSANAHFHQKYGMHLRDVPDTPVGEVLEWLKMKRAEPPSSG